MITTDSQSYIVRVHLSHKILIMYHLLKDERKLIKIL